MFRNAANSSCLCLLPQQVTLRDLASQFYLSEGDVGKNRAEACRCVSCWIRGSVGGALGQGWLLCCVCVFK